MKYIISLIITLWSITAWGQGDGFNPSNPQEPGQLYSLTVKVSPEGAGSTNPAGKKQYALGQEINLNAYGNTGYRFIGWKQGEKTLSDQPSFTYVIPAEHTDITALFEYRPGDPAEPGPVPLRHKLFLDASPAEGGGFNITSGTWVKEGETINLQAYLNSGYEFVGWKLGDKTVSTDGAYSFAMGTEDLSLTALFRFNPANPGNPGANRWNAMTGELIIDDFQPGNIMSAIDAAIGGSGNREKVTMVIVSGQMSPYDFGISSYLRNCTLLDLSRTRGYDKIPDYTFYNSNLTVVILPAIVEQIGNYAFLNCKNLTDISCYSVTPPAVGYNVFDGINEGVVLHVLSSAISLYSEAEGWKELTILPLTEEVRTLEVKLPAGSEGSYKNMTLELANKETGQKQKYVVSDRSSYTFNGLLKNCEYSVTMKTPTGSELGKIDGIKIEVDNVSVAFASLLTLQDVNVKIQTPDGADVTEQIRITWLSGDKTYLAQGSSLKGQTAESPLIYRMELGQDLGMKYLFPLDQSYTVKTKDNQLVYKLEPIKTLKVKGLVKDATGGTLSGAVVSISQKLNGKYSKSFISQTDAKGTFSAEVYDTPSTIAVSAADFISQTFTKDDFKEGGDLGTIALKTITGATISLGFTYTSSVVDGETPSVQDWYSDYENVAYSIYNITKNKEIKEYSVQYPSIVLLEEVTLGDQLRITVSSKNKSFMPVESTLTIDEKNRGGVTFNIMQLGGIQVSYSSTDNAGVVGILYDGKGELVKKYAYSNKSLSINELSDGTYTLVSMANSMFFNSILKLSQLAGSGLIEGTDYLVSPIRVKSGLIAQVINESVPVLNESKLYYTGNNTAFTVNKTSIVAGNYLTLKGQVDFKSEYASAVRDVRLIVDLPESCSFVDNSVMVGSKVSGYTLDGTRLTIPMDHYTDQVRFCIIPTEGGTYNPNAFAEFTVGGKTVQQPIGSAYYEVKDLTISVPKTVAKKNIPVSGTAQGNSMIEIYDNNILIGNTFSLANGLWTTSCDLYEPYNLSVHHIYSKVTTNKGIQLQSEIQEVVYDINAIEVDKVTMVNVAHPASSLDLCEYVTVFDFQKPKSQLPAYWYWPSYPDFTFKVEFTNNSPSIVSEVVLYVKTSAETLVKLPAVYDEKKDIWTASGKFYSEALPINLSVDYISSTDLVIDKQSYKEYNSDVKAFIGWFNELEYSIKNADQNEIANVLEEFGRNYDNLYDAGLQEKLQSMTEEEMCVYAESLIEAYESKNEITDVALTDTLFYNIYNSITLDNGVKMECTTSENLSVKELLTRGFEVHQTIDSDSIFTLFEENFIEIVSLTDNFHYKIYGKNINSQLLSLRLRASDNTSDFIAAFKSACEMVETAISTIDEWYERVCAPFGDLIELFEIETRNFEAILKIQKNTLSNCKSQQKIAEWAQKVLDTEKQIARHQKIIGGLSKSMGLIKKAIPIVNLISYGKQTLAQLKRLRDIGMEIYPCPDDQMNADNCAGRVLGLMATAGVYYSNKIAFEVLTDGAAVAQAAAAVPTGGLTAVTAVLTFLGKRAIELGVDFAYEKATDKATNILESDVRKLKCHEPCDGPSCNGGDSGSGSGSGSSGNGGGKSGNSGSGDVPHVMDPSGYVYEAVETNRLQGVTATCYYKEMVEDMYGDLHENIVFWDAAEYAQENPLFTDQDGMYAWDVPQGLWQVKFEKEGYQTTYSEWLPVPPPQLEVNIGMIQSAQPAVDAVRGFDTGIEVDFSKFMQPATLTTDQIKITRNGATVVGQIVMKNEEIDPQNPAQKFASKIRFVPAEPLATDDKVVLTISKRVKSYVGIQMENDYSQEIDIVKEPKAIAVSSLDVVYNKTAEITVTVEPAESVKGKKMIAASASPMIASIAPAELLLDESGKATFTVAGELLGQTMLRFEVEGMALRSEVTVRVVNASEEEFTRNYQLSMGWNWLSVHILDPNLKDAAALLEPIKESVLTVRGETGELINNEAEGWQGTLTALNPEQAYKIKVKQDVGLELRGKAVDLSKTTITLRKGWNWIGYLSGQTLSLDMALRNLVAEENDVIKGLDCFAIYDGTRWIGSLTDLLPGEGYVYFSQSVKSFNYTEAGMASQEETVSAQWEYAPHRYADNMTVLARVYMGEQPVEAGRYVIGAFSGKECRGVAVEKDGYWFLTIHGEESGEKINLRAFDTNTNEEHLIGESLEFGGTMKGSPAAPVNLYIGVLTGIESLSSGFILYPNPVRERLYIRGDIGSIREIHIVNANGKVCLVGGSLSVENSIDVSPLPKGVYFITIKTDHEVIQQKIIKM